MSTIKVPSFAYRYIVFRNVLPSLTALGLPIIFEVPWCERSCFVFCLSCLEFFSLQLNILNLMVCQNVNKYRVGEFCVKKCSVLESCARLSTHVKSKCHQMSCQNDNVVTMCHEYCDNQCCVKNVLSANYVPNSQ